MTTLDELVYDLWMCLSPNISDDSIMDQRAIKFWIHNQRALWLRNEFNKNREIDDNVIQDLGAIPVEIVDTIMDNPILRDKKILRTTIRIPVTIERYDGPTLTRVGPLDISLRPFNLIDYTRNPYAGSGKFNKNEIFTFLLGGYLYIAMNNSNPIAKLLKYISVKGVFENPEEVSEFTMLNGGPAYKSATDPYPINKWMIEYLKDAIIKADMKFYFNPAIDDANDASPDNIDNDKSKSNGNTRSNT